MTHLPITIRYASADDAAAVARLAALDSARVPDGPLLLAEIDDELWAAVPIRGGSAIADPFRPSGPLVEILRARARQLLGHDASRPRWRTLPSGYAAASMFRRT